MRDRFRAKPNIRLVYFRMYNDFCFAVGEDFLVSVSENADGFTEVYGTRNDLTRKLLLFRQPAIGVFREVSPTYFIYSVSGYLEKLFHDQIYIELFTISEFFGEELENYQ